jgi:serine/threonine protein kinase
MEAMSLDLPDADTQGQSRPESDWDWADRGVSHVNFHKDESLPFQEVRELGHGVNGPVVEVAVKGFRVALKKIYCRQGVTPMQLQEIQILKRLKHPHIIEVVGSYTRGRYLGILLYPVATCDLSTFLEDVDYLQRVAAGFLSSKFPANFNQEEYDERTLRCATVCGFDNLEHVSRHPHLAVLVDSAKYRLWRSYKCIASAIQHLHENSVRHKDLKPHNVLLSPIGLWVTDFGLSTDFSGISNSNTSGGERGTVKYCAPEIAAFQSSGRSADIYSLGCVFFEMAAISSFTLDEMKGFRPSMDGSFHNNMNGVASAFVSFGGTPLGHLPIGLARTMMVKDPKERPEIATVLQNLDLIQVFSGIEPESYPRPSCRFHAQPKNRQRPVSLTRTVSVTIGNTCQFQKAEPTSINGKDYRRTPTVVFVDCSDYSLIDRVIFFQVSWTKYFPIYSRLFS